MLLVQVEVRPDLLDEFERAIVENAQQSVVRDPGCLRFEVSRVVGEPTHWVFYEVYTDEAAWQRHRLSDHFLAYKDVADRALLSRTGIPLSPVWTAAASNPSDAG